VIKMITDQDQLQEKLYLNGFVGQPKDLLTNMDIQFFKDHIAKKQPQRLKKPYSKTNDFEPN